MPVIREPYFQVAAVLAPPWELSPGVDARFPSAVSGSYAGARICHACQIPSS
jgi:hypothetical protein